MPKQEEKEKFPMSFLELEVGSKGTQGIGYLAVQSVLPQIIMFIQLYSWHTVTKSDLYQRYIAPLL